MADITMCNSKDCPLANKCYRHNAKPSLFRQSWFAEVPYKDGKCAEFWEQTNEKQ